jgi:iron complex outermembrane receptor protein
MRYRNSNMGFRAGLLVCSALTASAAMTTAALAQAATSAAPDAPGGVTTLTEIVVTAQKRSQNLQNVPIAVTAVTAKILAANRITNVLSLGTVVPNLSVRASAGGVSLPAFTMRGITSYGVVPGSDKEISIYIDGVYIGSSTGSAFDLPDLQRIEVLRGPQGTLFGRNATAGAVSLITRDPSSDFGFNQELGAGNYRQFRSKTRVDTGTFGPLSASLTYVHDERLGDIKNRGAGQVWFVPASTGEPTKQVSPSTLGAHNIDTWFGAVAYKPTNNFKAVYKFDYSTNHYTASGVGVVGINPAVPLAGPYLGAVVSLQTNPIIFSGAERPDSVNNNFTTPSYSKAYGHNLTADYTINDHFSVKNILAYRYNYLRSHNQLDGLGGLFVNTTIKTFVNPGLTVGSPFAALGIEQSGFSKQWSDEAQLNYTSDQLHVTAGLLYFTIESRSGGSPGVENDFALTDFPQAPGYPGSGVFQNGYSLARNKAKSYAAYTQAEYKFTDQLEAVGGVRITKDEKTGSFTGDNGLGGPNLVPFTPYDQTKPSYMAGLNYKPMDNVLIYGKYSTAFVSGGTSGTISYKPETTESWEAGLKTDLFERRLRFNLALFDVKYEDIQSAQSGVNVGHPELGLVIIDLGNSHGRGFELETSAVPMKGLTLSASTGYTDYYFTKVNPGLGPFGHPATVNNFSPTLLPRWTANLAADYETVPLFQEMTMDFRVDAAYRSKELTNPYPSDNIPAYAAVQNVPAVWLVNAHVALQHIKMPHGQAEIDLWANNLFDDKSITFPDILGDFVAGTEYQSARTVGVDFKYNF